MIKRRFLVGSPVGSSRAQGALPNQILGICVPIEGRTKLHGRLERPIFVDAGPLVQQTPVIYLLTDQADRSPDSKPSEKMVLGSMSATSPDPKTMSPFRVSPSLLTQITF